MNDAVAATSVGAAISGNIGNRSRETRFVHIGVSPSPVGLMVGLGVVRTVLYLVRVANTICAHTAHLLALSHFESHLSLHTYGMPARRLHLYLMYVHGRRRGFFNFMRGEKDFRQPIVP